MKKIMVFLLSLTIVFTPTLVFANNLGGWTITNSVIQGASTLINATKNVLINGSNVVKTSTAIIKPNAVQVAKVLRGGAAGYALSIAVEQLLGAVDWVLDPTNNQIKYWENDPAIPPNTCASLKLIRFEGANFTLSQISQLLKTNTNKRSSSAYAQDFVGINSVSCSNNNVTIVWEKKWCTTSCSPGVVYQYERHPIITTSYGTIVGEAEKEEQKTLPLSTVAAQVISNAESSTNNDHKVGAQVATTTAAQDMLANDAATQTNVQNQFETNAKTQTSEEAAAETKPKDPTAPELGSDIAIKFPVFCTWAPTLCEAAQKVITFPDTLVSWWTTSTLAISTAYIETMEWFKKEPESNSEQIDIETPTPFDNSIFTKDRFQVSRQCPVPQTHSMTITGQTVSFTFDLTPLCNVLEMARPALIACSYLYAAYIVIGASRNG
ncbi:virulence factor TspB C-terminal domain-related protein [Acinetobacter junii]|uniref:virulence factor TspB C-terminal domain-related protein n=1 Tax=Acinetobacter junii TaxID=40215 RepID=UPI0030A3D524